ncbi:MAG: SDR family NAD(P)-dependent oxidoreductase [Caldilineaceae bacterium]
MLARCRECDLALSGKFRPGDPLSEWGKLSLDSATALMAAAKTLMPPLMRRLWSAGMGAELKRLSDALADGDTIYAVIRGSAVNHNGRSGGFTVPSGPAQEELLQQALTAAHVAPHAISYVEAHGTGTFLGDPIEIGALGNVLCNEQRTTPLLVGSVKTNIGHLEPAAGIAGLIKVILALYHQQIPPHLHFHQPNPHIPWTQFALQIPTTVTDWPADKARLAGVSSFGLSGVNAHVIVEAAPPVGAPSSAAPSSTTTQPWQLFTLSAKEPGALRDLVTLYHAYLQTYPTPAWADLCYTAHVGRSHFAHRLTLAADGVTDAQRRLAAYLRDEEQGGVMQGIAPEAPPKVAFLFTGQGAQYLHMGRTLYETQPVFRQVIDRCEAVAQSCLGRSLLELLYPATPPTHHDLLASHPCGQAANYALECALADLWQSWGITPDFVLGHSLGDFAAAYTAGVFSLEDGLRLVSIRGRLMETAVGKMVSVLASEATVAPYVAPHPQVTIAVFNGPESVVISGETSAVATITAQLQAAGLKTRPLAIPVAAHSPLLDPVLADFEAVVRGVALAPPKLPVISSMTGERVTTALIDPVYWRQHLRQPVRFATGVQTLLAQGATLLLEIGPKPTLLGLVETILEGAAGIPPTPMRPHLLPSLRENYPDWQQMLESLGALYVHGCSINWPAVDQADTWTATEQAQHKVVLPTYPFQRQRYWIDPPRKRNATLRPLVDRQLKSPLHKATIFETEFSLAALPFLADHRVYDAVVAPGACQIAMILQSAALYFGQPSIALMDVVLPQALVIPADGAARTVQTVLTPVAAHGSGPKAEVNLISFDPQAADAPIGTHATGYVTPAPPAPSVDPAGELTALRQRCQQPVDVAAFYADTAARQIQVGPRFRWIAAMWQSAGEALAHCTLPEAVESLGGYLLHPGLLDACFQVVGAATQHNDGETLLPFSIAALHLYPPGPERKSQAATAASWWCHVTQIAPNQWQIRLLDAAGQPLAALDGYEMRAAPPDAVHGADRWREWLYAVEWQARPLFGLCPDYLPAPAALTQPLSAVTGAGSARDSEEMLRQALEQLSIDYVLAAFAKAGFTFQPGARWRTAQIAQQLSVLPTYHRLLARALTMLAEVGILQADGDQWRVLQTPVARDPHTRLTALQSQYAAPALTLLARCGDRLGEVLRGVQEPLALLFPDSDDAILTQLYTATAEAKIVNTLVQQVMQHITAHLPSGRGLRILEIGAGTGSTTVALLPHLQEVVRQQGQPALDYVFTDIGPTFLTKAQARFVDYDFLQYRVLDIEQAPSAQGFGHQQYDIIIAANVFHATQDLAVTLAHVRQLLQPGGLLLLVETGTSRRWLDLTFGLTDGWWRFADARTTHPLLSDQAWASLLHGQGFAAVATVPVHDQILLVAQAATTVPPTGRTWLILADDSGLGAALATELRQRGEAPLLVYPAATYAQSDAGIFQIRPDRAEDYQTLLAALPERYGVIFLWGLTQLSPGSSESSVQTTTQGCSTLLSLTQALLQHQQSPTGLWLVTQATQAVSATDDVSGVAQAPLWGMGKVIALEHPELTLVAVDLDGALPPAAQAAALCAELTAQPVLAAPETQVALRQGLRYVARLQRYPTPQGLALPPTPYRLEVKERGTLEQLQLAPVARQAPAANEVEIRVQACGLNFLDVLDVLGVLPFTRDLLGGECAGEVVAVGADVTRFQVGDRVLAVKGSFSEYITVAEALVATLPPNLRFTEAATIPINFLTASYALQTVAGLAPGDKVLIHAAAGGTGLAAVQIAQAVGAEVYATASPGKWATLRAMGVTHLYNSRTLDFADQILADTGGRGLDLVLNSLTGEGFIAKSLSTLAPGGRFLEIAKRDVWSAAEVAAFRADVRYHFVDLFTLIQREPLLIRTLLERLLEQFATGVFTPVQQSCFPIAAAAQAFRYMQQAKHIGKIVLTLPVRRAVTIRNDATYLITGGLGGLGLAVAQWLADQGARQLVLVGRSRPQPAAQAQLDALTAQGVMVTVTQADVTDGAQVAAVLAAIDARYPLRGLIHAVGVLRDGVLVQQNWANFAEVLAPKVQGTWHLHGLTQGIPLDFFVLFSSGTSLLGNRGQANHAAANAFLDAFAEYRLAQGLPALSINWGAWSEIGAAADLVQSQQQQMAARGMGIITPQQGLQAFAHLLQQSGQIGVTPVDWPKYLVHSAGAWPFYAQMSQSAPSTPAVAEVTQPIRLRQQLTSAPPDQRTPLLLQHLRSAVANVLGLRAPEQIDPRQGLLGLGMDSLMAIELRNRLGRTLEQTLPTTVVFDYPTLEQLQQFILATIFGESAVTAPPTTGATSDGGKPVAVDSTVAALSAEELMAQIAADFETIA